MSTGKYGVFPGQAASKQTIWLALPVALLFYSTVFMLVLVLIARNKHVTLGSALNSLLKEAVSVDWAHDFHSVKRLLKHSQKFTPLAFGTGIFLLIFYIALALVDGNHYSCWMWSAEVVSLGASLYPWEAYPWEQKETATQWLFVVTACLFYVFCTRLWGPDSAFGMDLHTNKAHQIYAGLVTICDNQMAAIPEYKAIAIWVKNSIGDYARRREKTKRHNAFVCLSWLLHIPAACFLAFPNICYIFAQNIPVDSGLLKVLSDSLTVVVFGTILRAIFVRRFAHWLVKVKRYGLVPDEMNANTQEAESKFLLQFLSDIAYPVFMQIIIDENCLR